MSSATQVRGQTIQITMDGVMSVFRKRIEQALADQGIEQLDSHEWYPIEQYTAVLQTIEEDAGASTLRQLGEVLAENLDWDGDPQSPDDALEGLTDSFRNNHRKLRGGYEFEADGDRSGVVDCDTSYPCEFDKGVLKGTMRRFDVSYASVDESSDTCREDGGSACTYEVSWN